VIRNYCEWYYEKGGLEVMAVVCEKAGIGNWEGGGLKGFNV